MKLVFNEFHFILAFNVSYNPVFPLYLSLILFRDQITCFHCP